MTEAEKAVLEMTANLWNAIAALGEHNPSDLDDYMRDIHDIQHRLMSRVARRAYPSFFHQPT